jgi:hypothetical protein
MRFGAITMLACTISLMSAAILPVASAQDTSPSGSSQKTLDLAAARAQRKAAVGANMQLTPEQAAKFWPIYDQYEAKMDKIDERHVRMLNEYAASYNSLTDADATKKLDETLAVEQGRVDVQKAFVPKFRADFSSIMTTRFFQIDNKMHALVQCRLAEIVPLASPPANSP